MDRTRDDREVLYPGSWRQGVQARVRQLRSELRHGRSRDPKTEDLIAIAGDAAERHCNLLYWWNGTLIERSWLALHEAEARMVAGLPRHEALMWWQCTTSNRPQAHGPDGATGLSGLPADSEAAGLSLRAYYAEADQLSKATRVLRNRLIVMTLAGLATSGLLLLTGGLGGLTILSGRSVIVAGAQFVIVALFGAVGAFISGLPALSSLSRHPVAYRTAPYQLSLKLATGPVFALVGVMALGSGFLDNVLPLQQHPFGDTILLWAVVFGGAQQLVTRMLDRKAAGLADESAAVTSGDAHDGAPHPVIGVAQSNGTAPPSDRGAIDAKALVPGPRPESARNGAGSSRQRAQADLPHERAARTAAAARSGYLGRTPR